MNDQENPIRVFAYAPLDNKVFVYQFVNDAELQETVATFMMDIWFVLSDEEVAEYFADMTPVDNLKHDFIWFRPKINGLSIMECTCGQFLESDRSFDKLAKLAVRHSRRTGHTLNPRGN